MKIHTILNKEGTIDAKLFGEWRVKSYLIIALSCIERDDLEGATAVLKKAKVVAMEYIDEIKTKEQSNISKEESASLKGLTLQVKEVRRLMADCVEKKKEAKKKEKRRAQAMFSPTKEKVVSIAPSKKDENETDTSTPAVNHVDLQDNQITSTDAPDVPSKSPTRKSVLNGKSTIAQNVKKSVSFSQNPPQVKEFDSFADDNEGPWYSEHREALVLMALAGLSIFAFVNFRRRT